MIVKIILKNLYALPRYQLLTELNDCQRQLRNRLIGFSIWS